MDTLAAANAYLFEGFRLDRRGLAWRDDNGCFVPVPVGSRALEILGVLVQRSGELVPRDEIINAVWPGVVVEDSNLPAQIGVLRRVLDNGRTDGSCIQTIPGRGYRFVVPVRRRDQPASSGILSPFAGGAPEPPRLSIVVLPFTNLSSDPEQQYFADGITEDLTTDLSRLSGMLVISHNTAVTYRNKPVDTKLIGRELGVRYVLEGSVRRSGSRVRINAQLIDAETDTHLWAERFDGDTSDLFALQDEITSQIAFALHIELTVAEAARPTEHAEAMDYVFRGRALFQGRAPSRNSYADAIRLLEQALALDPQSAEAQTWLANVLVNRVNTSLTDTRAADLTRAEKLIDRALTASRPTSYAHYVKGTVLRNRNSWDEATLHFETSLSINRNTVGALQGLGWCKLYTGSLDDAIAIAERAIRIGPRDPTIGFRYLIIGTVYLLQSRIDEAVLWLEKGRGVMPDVPNFRGRLASAYALRGETQRAAAELAEARRLAGGDVFSSIARIRASGSWGSVLPLFEATYFEGLRKAGMPEDEVC